MNSGELGERNNLVSVWFSKSLILFCALLLPAFSSLHYSLTVLGKIWAPAEKKILTSAQLVECSVEKILVSLYISCIEMFSLPYITRGESIQG